MQDDLAIQNPQEQLGAEGHEDDEVMVLILQTAQLRGGYPFSQGPSCST
jgi:hypothetical protein